MKKVLPIVGYVCGAVAIRMIVSSVTLPAPVSTLPTDAPPASVTAPAPNEKAMKTAEVPLSGSRQEHQVMVTLNGIGPYNFVLDTGASGCMIPAPVVTYLKAHGALSDKDRLGDTIVELADDRKVSQEVVRLEHVHVEGVNVSNVACTISPGEVGLLGMGFLGRFDMFMIDNANNTLMLKWKA
jgi:predicted aspartyl protease